MALLLVAMGVVMRMVLTRLAGPGIPTYITFSPFVMLAALIGGWGPGLLATLAMMAVVTYWLLLPLGAFRAEHTVDAVGLAFFCVMGILVSIVAELYRRTRDHLDELVGVRTAALNQAKEQFREQAEQLQTQAEELAAANAALRGSEERLHRRAEEVETLMKVAPVAIWVSDDPQCNNIIGNPTADSFYEAGEQENVSANVSPVRRFFRNGQELKPEELPMQEAVTKNIDIRNIDLDVLLPSGKWLNMLGSASPLRDSAGRVRGCIGAFVDITKRRQAEQALRDSEERLRLALEGGRMGQWEWDLRTDSLFWCRRIYELLGLETFRKPCLKTFLNRVHPNDQEAVKRFVTEALNERKDLEVEFRVLRCWQERRSDLAWLAFRAAVIRDEQGQAVRMIGVMYDITPRKQMEEELRRLNNLLGEEVQAQTEELRDRETRLEAEVVRRASVEDELREQSRMLEAFFQHTITPLAFLDKHFNYVRVNQAYAEAAGEDPEYFVAKNYFALHPNGEDRRIFEQVVQTQQPYHAYAKPSEFGEAPHLGTRYWNWLLTPLFDARGQVQFLVLNLEDVTGRQKAFQELAHRARQLQKLMLELSEVEERERERLAEILHDDLQQTLAAAKFHLGLVSHRCKGDKRSWETAEQVKRLLTEAIGQSRRLSHELSPPGLTHNDLGETFAWLADQVKAKHGLTVYVDVADRMEVQSEPLKALLYRATQELLFNIAKHARVREARLRLRRRRESIYLLVSDKGCGFDPQQLPKSAGFGLLSIRERIDLLGGRMKVRSTRGKGSTFLVVVPDGASTKTDG